MIGGRELERFTKLTESSKEIWVARASMLRGWESGGLEIYDEVWKWWFRVIYEITKGYYIIGLVLDIGSTLTHILD